MRPLNKLTDTECKALSKPGRYSDGGGLRLNVSRTGAKSWSFMWTRDGTRREMGLGGYPAVKRARARKLASDSREAVEEGRDPIAERQEKQSPHLPSAPRSSSRRCRGSGGTPSIGTSGSRRWATVTAAPSAQRRCPRLPPTTFIRCFHPSGPRSTRRHTAHGFRSAFRDWCGDCTTFPREIAEAALAHQVGNEVERSYRRADALEKRRKLMQAWSDYCERQTGDNVIRLRK